MNAVTVIEAGQVTAAGFEEWLNRLRLLFDERGRVHWNIADHLKEGQEGGYLTQIGFDYLSGELGVAPKPLKDALKAAQTFPPALRDPTLSVEHHAAAAAAPDRQMRLEFLSRAKREHWTPEQTRHEAVKVKPHEARQIEESPLESFLRHWNRLPDAVRVDALEIITASNAEIVDPISGERISQ